IDVEILAHSVTLAGRPARLVLAKDVTERLRLEEQLRQAQKMEAVGRLAGGVAHDFNNILTAILGSAELLIQDLPEGHEHRIDAEEIRRAAQRAADLTRQLLAFSRQQELAPKVLDLNAVVQGVERMLRRLIGENIELRTTLAGDLGAGVGVATVYGVVKQSGGHIWVYSEPGHGSTFKIYLPAVAESPEPLVAAEPVGVREPVGGTETILLVEDEQIVRSLARRV